MQIVSENNLAHFLEIKAKKSLVALGGNATKLDYLNNLCLVYDDCESMYENACLDGYDNFDDYFLNKAELTDGYFKVGQYIKAVTFNQLNDLANQCANYFIKSGLKQGDKLGVMIYNSFEFAIIFFASFKCGLTIVPINALLEKSGVLFIQEKTQLKYMLIEDEFDFGLKVTYLKKNELLHNIKNESTSFTSAKAQHDDLAFILFTSGTTSFPKGCKITHYNILYASHFTSAQVGIRKGDTFATSMPHWHIDLLATAFMPSLRANARFVLFNRFSGKRFWKQLVFYEANISEVIPKMIDVIKLQPSFERETKHKLRMLLYFLNMSDEKYKQFKNRFKVDLFTSYGLSESIVGILGDNHYEDFKFGAIGKVYFGVDVIIAHLVNGKLVACKANELGEICIKGRLGKEIFAGYYENDEAMKKSFCDGYFLTGDTGYYDDDGWFYFHSRNKDLIKINGENVSAIELENKLGDCEFVKDASVIGTCDKMGYDIIVAFIELNDDFNAEVLKINNIDVLYPNDRLDKIKTDLFSLNNSLASFKQIKEIIFLKNLPYNHVGKVQKNLLGEVYGRI